MWRLNTSVSHITPEAHLDNFDKSRYEVKSGRLAGGAEEHMEERGERREERLERAITLYLTGTNTR